MSALLRGRVYGAVLQGQEDIGEKYYLVVSNGQRNRNLESVLAVRLTTTPKRPMSSIVETRSGDPFTGRVLCDSVVELFEDEVRRDLGAMTRNTMRGVENGLRAAFGLPLGPRPHPQPQPRVGD